MSGPIFANSISLEDIIADMVRERQRRLKALSDAINRFEKVKQNIKQLLYKIEKDYAKQIAAIQEFDELQIVSDTIKDIKNKYIKNINDILAAPVPSETKEILALANTLEKELTLEVDNYNKEISIPIIRIQEYIEKVKNIGTEYNFTKNQGIDIPFLEDDFDFSGIDNKVIELIKTAMEDIESIVNQEFILPKEQQDLLGIANAINSLAKTKENITEKALKSINAQYHLLKSGIIDRMNKFETLYTEYISECIDYANMIGENPVLPPREKFAGNIDELAQELDEIREKSYAAMCSKYIREQIDEVMDDFGYNLSHSLVLNENQKGEHILCANEKDDSAVHLYMSQKNEIMIEIVGHDEFEGTDVNENDIANAKVIESKDLSLSEREELVSKQKTFCEIQKAMVKELGKRGIIIDNIKENPADEKYCKKILTKKGHASTKITAAEKIKAQNKNRKTSGGEKLREMKD